MDILQCNLTTATELRKKVEDNLNVMTPDEVARCSLIISEFEKALMKGQQICYFNVSLNDKMKRNLLKLGYRCGFEVGKKTGWISFAEISLH